jgi:hypothetical protein
MFQLSHHFRVRRLDFRHAKLSLTFSIAAFPVKENASKSRASSHPTTFEMLDSPMFTICQGESVIQVLPSALRFWEKLGLGPAARAKDVVAFALFDHQDQGAVKMWLDRLSRIYSVCISMFYTVFSSSLTSLDRPDVSETMNWGLLISGPTAWCLFDGTVFGRRLVCARVCFTTFGK